MSKSVDWIILDGWRVWGMPAGVVASKGQVTGLRRQRSWKDWAWAVGRMRRFAWRWVGERPEVFVILLVRARRRDSMMNCGVDVSIAVLSCSADSTFVLLLYIYPWYVGPR